MPTDISSIITRAAQVKNETVENANTASRVGGVLLDLAAFAAQGIFADEIAFEADAGGVSVRLRYHNAQGQPYERRAYIPALNTAAGTAGVLTASQYEAMKALGAVREVGVFTGTATAWAACATAEVAGNSAYRVLKYQIGTVHYYIEQSVRDNVCTQYLYEGQQRFIRTIRFASNDRTQVQNVGAWAKTGAQSISYTPSTRELRIKDFNGEDIGTKATLPVASPSTPGLLSVADKKKLDDCVTTPATTSAAGLMSADQVSDLMNALARVKVGYFNGARYWVEGKNAVLEKNSTIDTSGEVLWCDKIGYTEGADFTWPGFVYKVGLKYYAAAPGDFLRPMPSPNGIAINISDGSSYVFGADGGLYEFIPVATTNRPGLAPKEWLARFTSIEARLAALEGKATAAATADTADTAEEAGGEA